uniref:FBA_2 domain-containing protein n=1 Tax=Caenorhabditis tropicalis TaxID=1561998 RepID=A0A1I7TUL6_9PELO
MTAWIEEQLEEICVTLLCCFFRFLFYLFDIHDNPSRTSTLPENIEVFPLFHLPLLAREHVLSMMGPFELIDLSMTSSRAKRAVTVFSRTKPKLSVDINLSGNLDLSLSDNIGFYINGHDQSWVQLWITRHSRIGCERSASCIVERSENPLNDCLRRYKTIKEVLGYYINYMCVTSPNKSLTDWLRSQNSSISEITIFSTEEEDVNYFLKTIKVSGKINLYGNLYLTCNDFRLETPECLNHLAIYDSQFVNYEQLLRLKARTLALRRSILRNKDLNRFLKSWMSMESHLDLESFEIYFYADGALNEIMDLPNKMTVDSKSMEKMRKIDLSMTSSKARQSVTCFSRIKRRFWVTLSFVSDPIITIEGDKEVWSLVWTQNKLKMNQTPEDPHRIQTYSENPMKCCMKWCDEVFKGVVGRRINNICVWNSNKSMTDWLRSQQDSIEEMTIKDGYQEDVEYFLNRIRVLGTLEFLIKRLNHNVQLMIPEGAYRLYIKNSEFIEYEQFMEMNHPEMILLWVILTNQEINCFLKSWMACESHLNLKVLIIEGYGPEIVLDLPCEETIDPNILEKFKDYPFNFNAINGFNIKRSDGKMATLVTYYNGLRQVYTLCFLIQ